MKNLSYPRREGFTLIEIMIVVAIIALLASIALPSFIRARKRSQASIVKEDLRSVDSAIDQYALETNKVAGMLPTASDVQGYVKKGTRLYNALGSGTTSFKDDLSNDVVIPSVDALPKVASATYAALSDVANSNFWAPFPTP